jgi:hypothetical protein
MTGTSGEPTATPNPYGQAMPAAATPPPAAPESHQSVKPLFEDNGVRFEIDPQTGASRIVSTTGRPLKPLRTPAEERQLRQAQRASAHFEDKWSKRLDRLRRDPAALKQCLDESLALPVGASRAWGLHRHWLHSVSSLSGALGVTEEGLRAALELVSLWPLSPLDAEEEPLTLGEHHIRTAMWYSALYDTLGVFAAVRGFPAYGWSAALRWSVLAPLKALKGYDDRAIGGGREAISDGSPWERTYSALPVFQAAFRKILDGLRLAHQGLGDIYGWSRSAYSAALAGDAPLDVTGPLGRLAAERRLPHEERQQTANDERRRDVDRYFRAGDRIFNVPLVQELEALLERVWLPRVESQVQAIEQLIGDTAKRHRGKDGRVLAVYRRLAARLAATINRQLPDRRQHRKQGVHRGEVHDRTAAILRAVYGVAITPSDVKASVVAEGKRAKTQK